MANTVTEMITRTVSSGGPLISAPSKGKAETYSLEVSQTQSNIIDAERLTSLSLIAIYQLAFSHLREAVKLAKHLATLRSRGVISDSEMDEILLQHSVLEQRRGETEKHIGEVVVVYDRELFFGSDLTHALERVKMKHKSLDRKYYSESIGIVDYPSLV